MTDRTAYHYRSLDMLEYWGRNILVSHQAEWRKHRKAMQPAFNPEMSVDSSPFYSIPLTASGFRYEMVWSETRRLYNEMVIAEKFPVKSGDKVSFAHFENLTQRLALCIILSCGMGQHFNWDEKDTSKASGTGFKVDDGVKIVGDNLPIVGFAPNWLYKLPIEQYVHHL
jgi:hypothetical protein